MRRLQQPRGDPLCRLFGQEQPEKVFDRPEDIQVGEGEGENVKSGDEPAHAQDRDHRAVHAFVQDIVGGAQGFFRRRVGQGLGKGQTQQAHEKDGEQVRGEQDRARFRTAVHGAAHAAEQEHGAGGGAQNAHAPRLCRRDGTACREVGDDAAADGIAG